MLFFTQNIQINTALVGLLGAHLCFGMVDWVVLDHTEVPKYEVQSLQRIQEGWQVVYVYWNIKELGNDDRIPPSWLQTGGHGGCIRTSRQPSPRS